MAGPKPNLARGWKLLRRGFELGPSNKEWSGPWYDVVRKEIVLHDDTKTLAVIYNVADLLWQCVIKYKRWIQENQWKPDHGIGDESSTKQLKAMLYVSLRCYNWAL